MTDEEKKLLAEKEKEMNGELEKKALDERVPDEAATAKIVEKAQANGITA